MTFQQDFEVGTDERYVATQYKLRETLGYPQKKYDTLQLLEKIESLHKANGRLSNLLLFAIFVIGILISVFSAWGE